MKGVLGVIAADDVKQAHEKREQRGPAVAYFVEAHKIFEIMLPSDRKAGSLFVVQISGDADQVRFVGEHSKGRGDRKKNDRRHDRRHGDSRDVLFDPVAGRWAFTKPVELDSHVHEDQREKHVVRAVDEEELIPGGMAQGQPDQNSGYEQRDGGEAPASNGGTIAHRAIHIEAGPEEKWQAKTNMRIDYHTREALVS